MCEVPKVRKDFEAWCFLGTERKPQRMEQGEGEKVPRTGTGRTLNFSPSQREFSGRSKYINFFFGNNFRSRVTKRTRRVPLYHLSSISREMT